MKNNINITPIQESLKTRVDYFSFIIDLNAFNIAKLLDISMYYINIIEIKRHKEFLPNKNKKKQPEGCSLNRSKTY